jgi:integrase
MRSAVDRIYEIACWAEAFKGRTRASITAADIRRVLEQWRRTGRQDGHGGLALSSLNRRRTSLMGLYTALDGRAAPNPVRDVPKYDESGNQEIRAADPRLLYRIIARVGRRKWKARRWRRKGTNPKAQRVSKTRARLRLMLWTGWPQAQIMRLTLGDYDKAHQTVWIGRRRKGKGAKGRRVPLMGPGAVRAMQAFIAAHAFGEFSTSAMHSAFARAVAEENAHRAQHNKPALTGLHPYVLRHTFGTEIAKVISDERAIQELMLHATPIQTRRYTEAATHGRLLMARDTWVAYATFAHQKGPQRAKRGKQSGAGTRGKTRRKTRK